MTTSRRIIGITGCPGAGKSTVAEGVAAATERCVAVPMDGFHLAQRELERLGRADRKGAPDTFDVGGYVALLRRIRAGDAPVWAPRFDRHLEEPIAGSIAIEADHSVVVTEGNYLLHDGAGWDAVRGLLDECWFVEVVDDRERIRRLIARHVEHGRTREQAAAWVRTVDEPNADLIRRTRHLADRVVAPEGPWPPVSSR